MENYINTMSGGTAAENENTNLNPNPNPESAKQMHQHHNEIINPDDNPVSLKANADRFECNPDTLKKNVKNDKLPALREGPKSAYLAKPSDVEKLLRNTPGIASIFHPKTVTTFTTGESHTQAAAEEVVQEEGSARATEAAVEEPDQKDAGQPTPKESEGKETGARKPRRRRGRGKGGIGRQNASIEGSLILKSLVGTSAEERLRITRCLNELAGLVAST